MSRVIKFRVWHKLRKRMYRVTGLSYSVPDGSLSHISVHWPANVDPRAIEVLHLDEVDLQQFTGLKDKDGREIYEGDIVRTRNIGQFGTFQGYVAFHEAQYQYKIIQVEAEQYNPSLGHITIATIEVIGNIYETPEKSEHTL